MPVTAITQHSPEQVMAYLLKHDKKARVTFLPPRAFLDPDRRDKYHENIFIVSASEYDRNSAAVRDMPEKHVFVFGNERLLRYYGLIGRETIADCVPIHKARMTPVGSYLSDLIAHTIEGSLFHKLMTYIYTLPSKTHQKPITHLVCEWLYEGKTLSDYDDMMIALSKSVKIPAKAHTIIRRQLSKPVASRLQQAFADLRKGKCATVGQAAIKHNVQPFELSYVMGNLEKTSNVTDKYVGNHGI